MSDERRAGNEVPEGERALGSWARRLWHAPLSWRGLVLVLAGTSLLFWLVRPWGVVVAALWVAWAGVKRPGRHS